jgi:hypothetical protein
LARHRSQGEASPQNPNPIEAEVQRLADKHSITGTDMRRRMTACFDRVVHAFAADVSSDHLGGLMRRFPMSLLCDSIQYIGTERGVLLIEQVDLPSLARRVRAVEYLCSNGTLVFTLPELAGHLRSFADFLRSHREYLIQTGLPPRCFRPCPWLYRQLGRQYDTRATSSPYPYDELFSDRTARLDAPPYQWVRSRRDRLILGSEIEVGCAYNDADLLNGMDPNDADRTERDRHRVFDLKLQILELVAEAAGRTDADKTCLWNAILGVLARTFNAEDVAFYFRLDRFYIGIRADALDGPGEPPDPELTPGGLTNLLEVVGHVDSELMHGMFDGVKRAIPTAILGQRENGYERHRWRYFKILESPDRHSYDAAIDAMLAKSVAVQAFWRRYRDRLREALRTEFRVVVNLEMMPHHVRVLLPLVQDYADQLQAKRERGECIVPLQGRNVFRKDGDSWTIQFGDKIISKPDAVGLFYIGLLLRHPDRPMSAIELRAVFSAWKADPDGWLRNGTEDSVLAALRDTDDPDALRPESPDMGESADSQATQEYHAELMRLEALYTQAVREGNERAATENANKINQIREFLEPSQGLGGRRRRMGDALKKARDAVKNAIDRVLADLARAHPPLHTHLRQFLGFADSSYCYSPRPPVEWEL